MRPDQRPTDVQNENFATSVPCRDCSRRDEYVSGISAVRLEASLYDSFPKVEACGLPSYTVKRFVWWTKPLGSTSNHAEDAIPAPEK